MTTLSGSVKAGLAVTGALAVTWAAGSAQAADVAKAPAKVAPTVGRFDPWNAFSIGFGAVGTIATTPTSSWSDYSYGYDESDVYINSDYSHASKGLGFTAEIGKDFHAAGSPIVFGLYGDLRIGNQSSEAYTEGWNNNNVWTEQTSTLQLTNGGSLIGRVGFLPNDKTLIYGLVGYSWQQYVSQLSSYNSYDGDDLTTRQSGTLSGLTLGLGGEVMLSDKISLKGEYRYTRLGSVAEFNDEDGSLYNGQSHGATDLHQIRVVLSAKFGG